ncbi:MAG: cytochrome c oxidase assembly factor Coa1 family protein, partial [Mesorhizobium sp.]|nr:cytochrome c oxidase assembly factor Coa1 family protein [Mesorhizobium sp.]
HFRQTQRRWAIAGLLIWAAALIAAAALAYSILWAVKGSEPYQMTMQAVRDDARVRQAIGETVETPFWVFGNIAVQAGGTGAAQFSIPISGESGNGRVISQAVRSGGVWRLRLLFVSVEGTDVPIVIANPDKLQIPNAPVDL